MFNNIKTIHICILLLAVFFTVNAYSQAFFDSTGRSFTRVLGFELEENSLNEIQEKLGNTVQYDSGDASASSHRIHYFISTDSMYITFDAGEMGGGKRITSYIISSFPSDEKYKINNNASLFINDIGGIRLGIKKSDFTDFFPQKYIFNSEEDKKISIHFENKIPMNKETINQYKIEDINKAYWTEWITIFPSFENGILVSLIVRKVTTY